MVSRCAFRRRFTPMLASGLALSTAFAPASAIACACGCGIFDVGVGAITPQDADSGLSVFARVSTMDQRDNRAQGHAASADDNPDKRITTDFYTLGATYMVKHRWLIMAELPVYHRQFTTTGSDTNGQDVIETVPLTAPGDALLRVTYTGFSPAMTTGLGLGVKLPTGRVTGPTDRYGNQPYDRDTMPGTGSTDVEFSGYHVGRLAGAARWFVQAQARFAVATRDHYRPGNEFNGAAGVAYDLAAGKTTLSPSLQLTASTRGRDSGANADPLNSGYQRLLLAPGLRVQVTRKLSVYAELAIPIAQYVNAARASDNADSSGQLVAPRLLSVQVNYGF
ncbi:hypothetical protein [Novosphingobium sp.]|uniref:hypothetical protein n=1 Tax=Novosphingobium sp. TaxID=1874826 RepID=UPI00333FA7E4